MTTDANDPTMNGNSADEHELHQTVGSQPDEHSQVIGNSQSAEPSHPDDLSASLQSDAYNYDNMDNDSMLASNDFASVSGIEGSSFYRPARIPEQTPPISSDVNMFLRTDSLMSHSGMENTRSNPHLIRRIRRSGLGESSLFDGTEEMLTTPSDPPSSHPQLDPNGVPISPVGLPDEKVKVIWGTNIVVRDAILAFKDFLANFTPGHRKISEGTSLKGELGELETLYSELFRKIYLTESCVFNLDMMNLFYYQPTRNLYHQLIKFPQEIVPLMDVVVNEIFADTFHPQPSEHTQLPPEPIQVRPFNCGKSANMRELNPDDIDQLVSIKGLVIRTSNIIPDMRTAFFKCSTCDFSVSVENVKGKIAPPTKCPRDECRANQSMDIVYNRCIYNSKQILRIQETPDCIPEGQTPHTVSMCVYDSLIDSARPGDKVEVTGIFRASPVRITTRMRKLRTQFRTFIDVIHIKRNSAERLQIESDAAIEGTEESNSSLTEEDSSAQSSQKIKDMVEKLSKDQNIYEILSRSICPSICGLENVKKSLLLQMLGGVSKTVSASSSSAGTSHKLRGDIHVLLAGDPGVSKSQLLQYVHKLCPRSVYTSGKGSSAVGLTAYITRDPETKQLVLESGALVLSDGGICCIDEFDKMSDSTRAVLHEVMEQQTISVAKAGIITSLNSRTSVLASANPVDSKYNPKKTIVDNLNLPPSLLSRFDIICLLLDNPDQENDKRIANHIVSLYADGKDDRSKEVLLDVKTLTEYISYCRKLEPVLSDAAVQDLAAGYLQMRKINGLGSGKAVSATTRQLESLIRLSEAHAKMRASPTVDSMDVAEAVRLMREALLTYAIDPLTGKIDIDLVTTGRSNALREQMAALKKAVKNTLSTVNSSVEYSWIMQEMSSNSPLVIPDKMLRDVLIELCEEEFVLIMGGQSILRHHGSNPRIRRII